MNKIDLETLTFTQMTKVLGIFNKMLESGVLQVDLDKSTAILNTNNATTYLENQNIQLQQENQELKKQLEVGEEQYNDLVQEKEELQEQLAIKTLELEKHKTGYIRSLNNQLSEDIDPDPEDFYLAEIEGKANDYDKLLIQQKEFIKYLEDYIKDRNEARQMHEMYSESENRLSSQYFILQEILQKYKELTGVSDEKEN